MSSALSSAEHLAVHLLLFGLLALDLGVHALHEFGHRRIIRRELGTALQVDLGLIVLTLGLTSGRATEEGLDAARIEEERLVACADRLLEGCECECECEWGSRDRSQ